MMDRRLFIKGGLAMGALASLPKFSFAQNSSSGGRIKVACVGCGGRGTGAIKDALSADKNIQIVALGDMFEDRIKGCDTEVKKFVAEKNLDAEAYAVTPETMFTGLDSCQKVLTVPCDVVILAAPPVFRADHLELCINADKNVFAEKPMFVDAVGARKVFALSDLSKEKGLTIVTGFQRRFDTSYQEGVKRLQDGQIGEIVAAQCYWLQSGYVGGSGWGDKFAVDTVGYQLRNWAAWIWSSGDHIVEQHCHNIDIINWCMQNKAPENVMGMGGRGVAQSGENALPYPQFGDRYSHFTVDFDYGKGVHLASMCRQEPKTSDCVMERIIGTKGILTFEGNARIDGENPWQFKGGRPSAYVREHEFLFKSVRGEVAKINHLKDAAHSNLMAVAGRESAFSGQRFKFDWLLAKSQQKLMPDALDLNAKLPVKPVPVAGVYKLS